MKKIIQLKLKILAKMIVAKYQPKVIGITGSVGKTSAKEAVYTVLNSKFNVRRSVKNYNNEIGVPLTIIGSDSPGKCLIGWIGVFLRAMRLILRHDPHYPKVLVLEMGIDKPLDMDYLLSIVSPDIGVVTAVGSVHLENFGTQNNLQKEKSKMIAGVKKDGYSIINFDNKQTLDMKDLSRAKVLTFGMEKGADVSAIEARFSFGPKNSQRIEGISFKMIHSGSTVPCYLPAAIGYNSIYASLVAASVGIAMKMNLLEISAALKNFQSPKGRMNLIEGIKKTYIIDDTYNSEPKSVLMGLETVAKFPIESGAKKFVILGDMLELGRDSVEKHKEIGRKLAEIKINILITSGERSRDIGRGAEEAGMNSDYIFHFATSKEAGIFVQDRISQGDLVYVKGSQGARMEKTVLEIMADPLRAEDLLVRQGKEWKNK